MEETLDRINKLLAEKKAILDKELDKQAKESLINVRPQ